MKALKTFIGGILAGISIAIGGTVFLSLDNKVLGALFFTVGLFAVCTFGFNLYTGKVCYVFDQDRRYALNLPLIWLGNLAGAFLTAAAERATRIGPTLAEKAQAVCTVKLNDGLLSILLLSVFCNMLIWLAVEGFKNNPHPAGKYLSLFFGVTVFILCGFEHCVANMYYFSVAGMWSWKTLGWILMMTLGNSAGGVLFPLLRKIQADRKAEKPETRENTQRKQMLS